MWGGGPEQGGKVGERPGKIFKAGTDEDGIEP